MLNLEPTLQHLEQRCRHFERRFRMLAARIERPKRWPTVRPILTIPLLSIWIRRRFRPYYRRTGRYGSLLEFGALGLVLLVSVSSRRDHDHGRVSTHN